MGRLTGLVVLAVVCAGGTARAQDSTLLRGTVQDPQGAAVAGATVVATCGPVVHEGVTGPAGEFELVGLPGGPCLVSAQAPYFETVRVPVDPSGRADLRIALPIRSFVSSVQVTATRGVEEERRRIPQGTSEIGAGDIDRRPYQLLGQALREETGILVQQTTSAQTSPQIRGFTGQSNVYLLDGVRFNNSSWRTGPSQYFSWIDSGSVGRVEIVRGPGSVPYGSDALGGTINVLSARPAFAAAGVQTAGDVNLSFGSAERSSAGGINLTVQSPRFALRGGVSGRTVGDLRTGGGADSRATVVRLLGLPTTFNGSRLPSTGYDQMGGYLTGQAKLASTSRLEWMYMGEDQSGASRYDRIDGGAGLYQSGFEPQRLDFGLVRLRQRGVAGLDELSGTFSVNRQSEGRYEQTRPTAARDQQESVTTVLGYQVQGQRAVAGRHLLLAGAEVYDETVGGARREQVHPVTGAVTVLRPDIPNDTTYRSLGVFVQDAFDLIPGRLHVRGGLRYGHFSFATKADAALGVVDESETTQAVTYQVGTVASVTPTVDVTFNFSRGFRAPNASDLGSVGLTGGGGFSLTPSRAASLGGLVGTTGSAIAVSTGQAVPALGPEVLYAYEPGVRIHAGRVEAGITVFDLEYLDSVERRAIVFPANVVGTVIDGYQVVRQDAAGLAYIAQDIRPIVTSFNSGRTRVTGFEAEVGVRLSSTWNAYGNFSMSNGRLVDTDEMVRRMSPPLGTARLRWSRPDGVWVEGAVLFAGAQTRLNSGDLTDARIGAVRTRSQIASYFGGTATDLGLVRNGVLLATGETLAEVQNRVLGTAASAPLYTRTAGFAIVNLRGGFTLSRHLDVTVIGENLFDTNYRLHGSGVDGPGANLVVRTRLHF